MPVTALALVLIAALLHAGWNIAAKNSGGGAHFVLMGALMGALMIVLLWAPLGLVLMLRDAPAWGWREWALLLAAFSPLGYVLVLYALQMAPLSHVAPAREVSMLFAALLGGRLLGETDRGLRLLGAACIVAGVLLLAL